MQCPQCHTANPDAQKYCGECGTQLEKICPVCDVGNPQEYRFCGECGNDLHPVGYFKIDRNGLITDVNPLGARLIGMIESAVIGKSFTLFVAEEDLAEFFTHRNAVFSTGAAKSCEIKMKKGDGLIDVHLECLTIGEGGANNDLMKLAIVDITENRRALEELQYRRDLEKIFISVSGEMIRCPAREIDMAIDRGLATICLYTEIDHGYICEMFDDKPGIKLTHEWIAPGVKPVSRQFRYFQTARFVNVVDALKKKGRIVAAGAEELPKKIQRELVRLNLPESQSFIGFPMLFGDALIGWLGYDLLEKRPNWPKDTLTLLEVACDAFLNSVIRQRDETAWYRKRKEIIQKEAERRVTETIDRSIAKTRTDKVQSPVKAKTLKKKRRVAGHRSGASKKKWVFKKVTVKDLSDALKVYEKGDKVVITCPSCIRRKDIVSPEIDYKTKTMRAKCPCGYEFLVALELRTVFRKQVNLEGYYILKSSVKTHPDSLNKWGSTWVRNISKSGIGFVTMNRHGIKPGDELKVKFNLDNTSKSIIHKSVVVKSVDDDYVACQFTEMDKYDVTLGFYLM